MFFDVPAIDIRFEERPFPTNMHCRRWRNSGSLSGTARALA